MYWIDKEKHAIERVNKSTGDISDGSIVMNQSPHLMDIISIYIPTPEVITLFNCYKFTVLYPFVKSLKYLLSIIVCYTNSNRLMINAPLWTVLGFNYVRFIL